MLLTHQVSVNDLSGPVGIVKTIGDTYDMSKSDGVFYVWMNLLNLALLLSANLGVMNLLPIPALDGGPSGISGDRGNPRKEGQRGQRRHGTFIGLLCLFGLMILIMI